MKVEAVILILCTLAQIGSCVVPCDISRKCVCYAKSAHCLTISPTFTRWKLQTLKTIYIHTTNENDEYVAERYDWIRRVKPNIQIIW